MQHNSFHKLPQTKSYIKLIEVPDFPPLGDSLLTPKTSQQSQLFHKNKSTRHNPEDKSQFQMGNHDTLQNSSSRLGLLMQETPAYQSMNLTLKQKIEQFQKKIQQNQERLDKLKGHQKMPKSFKTPEKAAKMEQIVLKKTDSSSPDSSKQVKQEYLELFKTASDLTTQLIVEKLPEKKDRTPVNEIIKLNINQREETFMIIKYLDEGSYGKVYLAAHLATGLILCIKSINKVDLNEEHLNRLVQEIKIQLIMNHPNILNLYGYTADAEKIYLLLEPCLGSNAYKRLSRAPLPEKDVRRHAKELCSAVEHLHRRDVIHRDVKAENVLFHEGTVKLCDFGWAVYAPMLRSTQCGTPLYTPPEIVKNEPYDSKVDLWCVGVLVYEMLYGTSPFEIRRTADLAKILQEQVFFSKQATVSEAAKDFIARCLEKRPIRRLNIRQALQHEFIVTKLEQYRHTLA